MDTYRHVNFFSRSQSLFFKTEALNLVEVETCFGWEYIVGGYPRDGNFGWICGLVEGQRSLTWNHFHIILLGFELPFHHVAGISGESNL
jgi:hypothetical protein